MVPPLRRWRSPTAGGASKAARPKEIVNLSDLDDDEEIRNVLLTEEEMQAKSAIWMEANKDYLEQQEGAGLKPRTIWRRAADRPNYCLSLMRIPAGLISFSEKKRTLGESGMAKAEARKVRKQHPLMGEAPLMRAHSLRPSLATRP